MSWETAKKRAEEASQGSDLYMKLKDDGEKVTFAIVGEPHQYDRPSLENAAKRTARYLFNVFVPSREPGESRMKVFEASTKTFQLIGSLHDEGYDFSKRFVRMKRQGKAGSPQTTYLLIDGGEIPAEILAEIRKTKPHDLVEIAKRNAGGRQQPQQARVAVEDAEEEDLPF